MQYGESIEVIKNLLYITSHRNRGAAWGILQGQMWFFYIITIAVVIGLVYYIQKIAKRKCVTRCFLGLNAWWGDWEFYRPCISSRSS